MIVRFDYDQTEEHTKEMAVAAEMVKTDRSWHSETLDAYTELRQFYRAYFLASTGREFARATQGFLKGPALRVLDVGAGRGETSLYLADHGHEVFPVEPSYEFCRVIEHMGARFGKELTIYNCSAEGLDLSVEPFDVVIFNCSLHHCDDAWLAMKNVARLLRPGGTLLVVGEIFLRFYKTQAQWLEELNASPEETGHYGGNEHAYHYGEYVSMMKEAGLHNIRAEVVARLRSREAIESEMAADPHRSRLRRVVKTLYCRCVCLLVWARMKPVIAAMQRLSLAQCTFSATK